MSVSFRNGAAGAQVAGPAERRVLPDLYISNWCCIASHFVTFWTFCKIGAHSRIWVDLVFRLPAEVVCFGLLRFDFRLLKLNPPIKANGNKGLVILDIRDPRRGEAEILETCAAWDAAETGAKRVRNNGSPSWKVRRADIGTVDWCFVMGDWDAGGRVR